MLLILTFYSVCAIIRLPYWTLHGGGNMDSSLLKKLEGSDDDIFTSYDEPPLTIREIEDVEIRFYFNPSSFDIDKSSVKPLITRASLRVGISGSDLDHLKFGEITIRLNPAISNEEDRDFVKKLFVDYFQSLKPITL